MEINFPKSALFDFRKFSECLGTTFPQFHNPLISEAGAALSSLIRQLLLQLFKAYARGKKYLCTLNNLKNAKL